MNQFFPTSQFHRMWTGRRLAAALFFVFVAGCFNVRAATPSGGEAALDKLAARLDVPREIVRAGGCKLILSGEFAGSPVWISNPECGIFSPGPILSLPANGGGLQVPPGTFFPLQAVPEPSGVALLALGGLLISGHCLHSRRRTRLHVV